MIVNSAIELYTTLLGWHLYNGIWGLLVGTGLVLAPFIVMVVNILMDSVAEEGVTAASLIRTLEFKLYFMLGVLFFGVQPTLDLYTENSGYYQSACKPDGSAASATEKKFGDTDTTYDSQAAEMQHMMDDRVAKIPIWWYIFTRLNYAATNALKHEIPCKADIRSVVSSLSNLQLSDPLLKDEANQFYRECYIPATNKFMRQAPANNELPNIYRGNIQQDVSWMGSDYFVTQPGYYDQLRPSTPIKAMPYSALRGDDVMGPDLQGTPLAPGPGWPTCDVWWKGQNGLRGRLLTDVKSKGMGDNLATYNSVAPTWYSTTTQSDNALLQSAIAPPTKRPSMPLNNGLQTNTADLSFGGGVMEAVSQDLSQLGLAKKSIESSAEAHTYKSAAPIVQAIVLMMLTLLLPLLMFFSLYELSTLVTLTVVQFSVIFWSFLFALAQWLDNFLLQAVMDQSDLNVYWFTFMTSNTTDILVITWITRAAYIALPIIFTTMMGLVGRNLAFNFSFGIDNLSKGAASAGSNGYSSAKSGVSKAAKLFTQTSKTK